MSQPPSTTASPRVSVIVVTHDDRERLIECLQSLEGQTLEPSEVEVVVVDDGSTDATASAVEARFPGVKVVCKPNEGADLSRNRGIEESTGDIIAFVDSDCVAPPNWLEAMVDTMEREPAAVVGGRVIHRGRLLCRVVGIADFGEYQGLARREARCLPTCNLALRRATLGEVRFDSRLADAGGDTLFTETLRRRGALLIYEPAVAVEHRPAVSFVDLMRRAARYGRSFVRARRVDPSLRHAGFVRAGVPGVIAATLARVALDWARLVRHRRAAGFALWEIPAAAAVLAVRRLASLPAALRAILG